jgi:hypothetical protein
MDLYRRFGPFLSGVVHEDAVLALRALLIGTVSYLPEPLIRYRVDSGYSAATRRYDAANIGARPVAALRASYRTCIQMRRDLRLAGDDEACLAALRRARARALTQYWMARKGRLSWARYRLFRRGLTVRRVAVYFLRYRAPGLFGGLQTLKNLGKQSQVQAGP